MHTSHGYHQCRAAKERGIRQEDLADLFGKSQVWASRYLMGKDDDEVRPNLLRLYVNQTDAWHGMMTMLGLDPTTMLTLMGVPWSEQDAAVIRKGIPLYQEGVSDLEAPLERVHVPIRAAGDVAAIRVDGDHLGGDLPDASLAFILLTNGVEPGRIALVDLPELGVRLRHFIEGGDAPMLGRSGESGPRYERVEGAKVLGVAIAKLVPV